MDHIKLKRHLLIKSKSEKSVNGVVLTNPDFIAQYFIFSERNLNYHSLIKHHRDYIYDLTEEQYKKLKVFKISQISKMTKKELFIFCDMEELLI
jgi:hypothetical protein